MKTRTRHSSTQSESPKGRRGEAVSRIGTLERQGGSRKGNPVAKPQNLTTQRREPPRLPQPPKDPNSTFEYWRRPRTLCLKHRYADSKTELGAGEKAQKQRARRWRHRHTATEARRRRQNRRTKWAEEATNNNEKKTGARKVAPDTGAKD